MNTFAFDIFISFSIALPAALALVKFPCIEINYYPFVFLIWIGLFNEALSVILVYTIRNNTVNSNIYVLLEFILILYQFYRWDSISLHKFYAFLGIGIIVWFTDNTIINMLTEDNSLFRIFYSFIIVFLSINQMNKIIVYEKRSLLKNTIFLICIAFLAYYGFKAFTEVFMAFHLGFSDIFNRNVLIILYFVNLLSNILYAVAIVCIPTKQEFTLQY